MSGAGRPCATMESAQKYLAETIEKLQAHHKKVGEFVGLEIDNGYRDAVATYVFDGRNIIRQSFLDYQKALADMGMLLNLQIMGGRGRLFLTMDKK